MIEKIAIQSKSTDPIDKIEKLHDWKSFTTVQLYGLYW